LQAKRDAPGALNFESGFQQVDNCLTLSSAERGSLHEHGQAQSPLMRESRKTSNGAKYALVPVSSSSFTGAELGA